MIMATKKFQSQFADTPMDCLFELEDYREQQISLDTRTYPLVRACRGRSSGPYGHGMQLVDAPKMSMNRKKKATAAVAVGFA